MLKKDKLVGAIVYYDGELLAGSHERVDEKVRVRVSCELLGSQKNPVGSCGG